MELPYLFDSFYGLFPPSYLLFRRSPLHHTSILPPNNPILWLLPTISVRAGCHWLGSRKLVTVGLNWQVGGGRNRWANQRVQWLTLCFLATALEPWSCCVSSAHFLYFVGFTWLNPHDLLSPRGNPPCRCKPYRQWQWWSWWWCNSRRQFKCLSSSLFLSRDSDHPTPSTHFQMKLRLLSSLSTRREGGSCWRWLCPVTLKPRTMATRQGKGQAKMRLFLRSPEFCGTPRKADESSWEELRQVIHWGSNASLALDCPSSQL